MIESKELRNKDIKIFLGMPMYGGMLSEATMHGLLDLQQWSLATGVAMTSQMDVIKETAGFGTGAGGTDGGSGDGKDQSDSEIDDDVEFNCPEGYQYSSSTKSCIPIDTSDRRENNQATTAFLNQVTNSHKVFLRDLTSNPDLDC